MFSVDPIYRAYGKEIGESGFGLSDWAVGLMGYGAYGAPGAAAAVWAKNKYMKARGPWKAKFWRAYGENMPKAGSAFEALARPGSMTVAKGVAEANQAHRDMPKKAIRRLIVQKTGEIPPKARQVLEQALRSGGDRAFDVRFEILQKKDPEFKKYLESFSR
jgi:hypothetical protein